MAGQDVEIGRSKVAAGDMYFNLFDRALHPELFRIDRSRNFAQALYQARIWIAGMSHVVIVHANQWALTELVSPTIEQLPDRGVLASFVFRGERDHSIDFANGRNYILSSQVEKMSEHLFRATHKDLKRTAQRRGIYASYDEWASSGMEPFVYVDYEARRGELHVHSFHVFPEDMTVIKTQSIIEVVSPGT